jgi:hypothetical protein
VKQVSPELNTASSSSTYLVPPGLSAASLPDIPDQATYIAEATFQEAVKALRGTASPNDGAGEEELIVFWPSLPVEDEDDDEW